MKQLGKIFLHDDTAEIMPDRRILAGNTPEEYALGFQWFLRDKFVETGSPYYETYKGFELRDFGLEHLPGLYHYKEYTVIGAEGEKRPQRFGAEADLWYKVDKRKAYTRAALNEMYAKETTPKFLRDSEYIGIKVFTRECMQVDPDTPCLADILGYKQTDAFFANVEISAHADMFIYENGRRRASIKERLPRTRIWLSVSNMRQTSVSFRKHGGIAKIIIGGFSVEDDTQDIMLECRVEPMFIPTGTPGDLEEMVSTFATKQFPKPSMYNQESVPDYTSNIMLSSIDFTESRGKKDVYSPGFTISSFNTIFPKDTCIGTFMLWKTGRESFAIPAHLDDKGVPHFDEKDTWSSWFDYAYGQWTNTNKIYRANSSSIVVREQTDYKTFGLFTMEKFMAHPMTNDEPIKPSTIKKGSKKPHEMLKNLSLDQYGRGVLADAVFERIMCTLNIEGKDPDLYMHMYNSIADALDKHAIVLTARRFGGDEFFVRPGKKELRSVVPKSTAYFLAGIFHLYNEKVTRYQDRELVPEDGGFRFYSKHNWNSKENAMTIYGNETIGYGLMDLGSYTQKTRWK